MIELRIKFGRVEDCKDAIVNRKMLQEEMENSNDIEIVGRKCCNKTKSMFLHKDPSFFVSFSLYLSLSLSLSLSASLTLCPLTIP